MTPCYVDKVHSGRIARMPADRRSRLIREGAAEFSSQGFANASLNRIIERCGMSKSSFYYLFESKEEFHDFVVAQLLAELAAVIRVPAATDFAHGDFWLRVEALFDELTRAATGDRAHLEVGRMFYSAAPEAARGAVSATLTAAREWVQDVLRVGRRRGAVRDDLPESLQCQLTFGVLQIFDEWSVSNLAGHDGTEAQALAGAQFATLRRLLATSA